MSFILDALRKSESERQQHATPGLADARYDVPKKSDNRWIPLLVVILAVNIVVMAFVLLNDAEDTDAQRSLTIVSNEQTAETLPTKVRPLSKEIEPDDIADFKVSAAERIEPAPDPVESLSEQVELTEPAPLPVSPESDDITPVTSIGEGLPSLQQLVLAGMISLPPLHLDMHVYSAERSQRFVFINMRKYQEAERLDEGPTVEEITETGAVLNHQGNRFFLDRE